MDGCVDSPDARALDDAARQYTTGLTHVIGRPAAQRHAMSLAAYQGATERLAALRATLAVVPSVDAADTEFLQQVIADQRRRDGRTR